MSQPTKSKEDVFTLKNKISELERQANEYKTKLDGLRRAKATTVIKFEKEYINSNNESTLKLDKTKSCDRCQQFELTIENQIQSNLQLKKLIEQKNNDKQLLTTTTTTDKDHQCQDFKSLIQLENEHQNDLKQQIQKQIQIFEQEKQNKLRFQRQLEMFQNEFIRGKHLTEDLQRQNEQYQNAFEQMKKEHQLKLEHLTQREEEAKKQVSTWEKMYREWMATMETRVQNLQTNNQQF